jgi:hypothetical protein
MLVVIATRANLMAKCRIILVSAPLLVIIGLVALNGRLLHLALTRAARGCARDQGNSPSVVASGRSGSGGLPTFLSCHSFCFLAGVSRSNSASE